MLQYFPLTLKTINSNVQKIGEVTDSAIQRIESDVSLPAETADQRIDLLQILEMELISTIKALQNVITVSNLTTIPSGFLGGKVIDTNENASNLKTFGTLFLGDLLSDAFTFMVTGNSFTKAQKHLKSRLLGGETIQQKFTDLKFQYEDLWLKGIISEDELDKAIVSIMIVAQQYNTVVRMSNFAQFASGIANGYHGYKRNNDSLGYGLAWALTGTLGLGLALEQGYAKPL